MTRIAILGSTGSIGTQTLDVARQHPSLLKVVALAAHSRERELLDQAAEFGVRKTALFTRDGEQSLIDLATDPEVDLVVMSIVGAAGMRATVAALQAGKRVALASKEVLVAAGEIVMPLAGGSLFHPTPPRGGGQGGGVSLGGPRRLAPKPSERNRDLAKAMRREPNKAEEILWERLRARKLGYKFRRQHPIGHYIVDFCCSEAKLIIELDGISHSLPGRAEYDAERDLYLAALGYTIMRISDDEFLSEGWDPVEEIASVLAGAASRFVVAGPRFHPTPSGEGAGSEASPSRHSHGTASATGAPGDSERFPLPPSPLPLGSGVSLTPIDSEHSALWQSLQGYRQDQVAKLILTASGGPFRGKQLTDLQGVTREQALKHPTWNMGGKITIDSATLMNKALEMIEAKWLFGVEMDDVEVVVHPQSVVHSMAKLTDGSVIGQLGWPDMRLPIQYALLYPERPPSGLKDWNPIDTPNLTFEPIDDAVFKGPRLARDAMRAGGTMPCALNAANEIAVEAFLQGQVSFLGIYGVVEECLAHHQVQPCSFENIVGTDDDVRRFARTVVQSERFTPTP